jgi:predicted nucleotidyltransferase
MDTEVLAGIRRIAQRYRIDKIVLLGSHTQRDRAAVSDYDIAVFSRNLTMLDQARFNADIEEIETLHSVNVTFIEDESNIDDSLAKSIRQDGLVIYE